jgi:hypothetical protein
MAMASAADLVSILRSLSRMHTFSLRDVEPILAVEFPPAELLPGGVLERVVSPGRGLFRRILLKEPRDLLSNKWLLGMDLSEQVQISEDNLRREIPLLSPPVTINPHIPPEGTVTFELNELHQTNYFGVRHRSRTLQEVAVHRPADGTTTVGMDPWR